MKPLHIYPDQLIPALHSIAAPDELIRDVAKWAGKGTRMVVTIKPEATRLSDRQREYYYAAVVPSFVAWIKDLNGTVFSPEKMDAVLRERLGFYTTEAVVLPDGRRVALVTPKSMGKEKGTGQQDMARFLDDCNSLHHEWFGCEMPPPREPLL
jgi:hypothetical protein